MKQANIAKFVVQIAKNVLISETIIVQFAMMDIIIKPTQTLHSVVYPVTIFVLNAQLQILLRALPVLLELF